MKFVFKAGILAAVFATAISALSVALLSAAVPPHPDTVAPGIFDIVRTALLLCPITAVSCGSYGFLAGLAGSALLNFRRRRIRSVTRLLVEAGIAGLIFGFLFPFFDRFVGQSYLNGGQMLFCAPVGALCALLCGVVLRRRFLAPLDLTQAPA